jgi:hypothetical protein
MGSCRRARVSRIVADRLRRIIVFGGERWSILVLDPERGCGLHDVAERARKQQRFQPAPWCRLLRRVALREGLGHG